MKRFIGVILICVLGSSCMSSVNLRRNEGSEVVDAGGVQAADEAASSGAGGAKGGVGTAGAGGGGGAADVPGVGSAAPPGAASAQAPPQAGEILGPGVRPARIDVGFLVPDRGWDGVFTALGTPGEGGVGFGDQRAMMRAIVEDMNESGGIAGRPINPLYFNWSFQRGLDPAGAAAQAQEACTYWTQDNRVFAVIQIGFESWSLLECLASRKVALFNTQTYISGSHYQRIADYYYNMTYNSLTRQAVDYAYGLKRMDFFGKTTGWNSDSKIGLITMDQETSTAGPDYNDAAKNGLVPELAKYGLKIAATAVAATDMTNAVVQFRNEGVTHVLYLVPSPVNWSMFMQAAENQQYRPWHAISSVAVPGPLLQYIAPPEQLAKSMGPGWTPIADVESAENPYELSAGQVRCNQIMEQAGQRSSDALRTAIQHAACLVNWFFQQAMNESRPNLTIQGMAGTIASRGSQFYSVQGSPFRFRYTSDRVNNGAVQFRPVRFDTSCNCYRYYGSVQDWP